MSKPLLIFFIILFGSVIGYHTIQSQTSVQEYYVVSEYNSTILDLPIAKLGNKSLKTYFEDENLISTTWGNRANTTHSFVNGELVVTATADGTTIGVQKTLNYSGNYYYAIVFKSDSLNTFNFAQATTPLTVLQTNVYQQNSGLKSFSADTTFRLYQSLLNGQTFTVKYAVFRQTTLTVQQMDYYFNMYQSFKQNSDILVYTQNPDYDFYNLGLNSVFGLNYIYDSINATTSFLDDIVKFLRRLT